MTDLDTGWLGSPSRTRLHRSDGEQIEWRNDALASWKEIKDSLSPELRQLCQDFVSRCDRIGALYCPPGCDVSLSEDGTVMFDWNDGTLPMFTVLMTPSLEVVDATLSDEGKASGRHSGFVYANLHLEQFMMERGADLWSTFYLRDSWLKTSEADEDSPHYTDLLVAKIYPSSPQTRRMTISLSPPEFMSLESRAGVTYTGGDFWEKRISSPSNSGQSPILMV